MTEPVSRAELDARLESIEAGMDARVARIEGKIDVMLTELRSNTTSIWGAMNRLQADVARLENLKTTVWGAAATVIAVVLSVVGLAGAFFESGRNTADVAREAARKEAQAAIATVVEAAAERAARAAVIAFTQSSGDRPEIEK